MQQYVFDNCAEANQRIDKDQQIITRVVSNCLKHQGLQAIILIGGYGREEGGYTCDGKVYKPYNDYDYFLVFKGVNAFKQRKLIAQIPNLESQVGIEVDFAGLSQEALPTLPYTLMHSEMLAKPTIVWGDQQVLSGCPAMPLNGIALHEFTRLMINRGCLLLMNLKQPDNVNFNKYIHKAMLACGDAYLACLGNYHYSYQTKLALFEPVKNSVPVLFSAYKRAVAARFRADINESATGANLEQAISLWLSCFTLLEQQRLQRPVLNWESYAQPGVDKGQSSGHQLKHCLINLLDKRLRAYSPWLTQHPRARIVSALPKLLMNKTDNSDLCEALSLSKSSNWQQSSQRLLQLWSSYS